MSSTPFHPFMYSVKQISPFSSLTESNQIIRRSTSNNDLGKAPQLYVKLALPDAEEVFEWLVKQPCNDNNDTFVTNIKIC